VSLFFFFLCFESFFFVCFSISERASFGVQFVSFFRAGNLGATSPGEARGCLFSFVLWCFVVLRSGEGERELVVSERRVEPSRPGSGHRWRQGCVLWFLCWGFVVGGGVDFWGGGGVGMVAEGVCCLLWFFLCVGLGVVFWRFCVVVVFVKSCVLLLVGWGVLGVLSGGGFQKDRPFTTGPTVTLVLWENECGLLYTRTFLPAAV